MAVAGVLALVGLVFGVLANFKAIFSSKENAAPEVINTNQNENTNNAQQSNVNNPQQNVVVNVPSSTPAMEVDSHKSKLVDAVTAGKLSVEEATKFLFALSGERNENAPGQENEFLTGLEPADEFIREFARPATSKNEKERAAAALDLEGRTEEALALLGELAEEETALAAERWKARGAMALNSFIATAIGSYERAIGCNPEDIEAQSLLGHLYLRTGDLGRAQIAYEHLVHLGHRFGNKGLISFAYLACGNVEFTRRNLDKAERFFKKSLEIEESLDRKGGMASAYGNLGAVEKERGALDLAENYHKQSLALNEELGRKEGIADQFGNLGLIERRRGNSEAAEKYFKRSLAIEKKLDRKVGIASDYGNLGVVERDRGHLDSAEVYHKKSLAIEKEIGRKEGVAIQYANLGSVEKDRGNIAGAVDYWRRALALYQEIGMPHMVEKVQGWIDEVGGEQ